MLKYLSTEVNVKSQLSSLAAYRLDVAVQENRDFSRRSPHSFHSSLIISFSQSGDSGVKWVDNATKTVPAHPPGFVSRILQASTNQQNSSRNSWRVSLLESFGGFGPDLWGIWKQSQGLISRGSPTRSQVASIKPAEGWAIQAMLQCFSVLPQTLRSIHGVCRIQPDSRSGWDLAQGSNCKKRMMNMPNIDFICSSKNIIYYIDF